ncbi:hypothetical protein GT043_21010 [Streptomyces sp. SID2131]|nr:hypothetical protein [Streptomyces sp. SID2131]
MRPLRFTEFVIDVAKNSPTCGRVQTFSEAGDSKHPFGVVVTVGASEARWQFTGQLPEGAKHEGFADEPVAGDPAPAGDAPQTTDSPEAWLAAALAQAESPEVARIERWSTQPESTGGSGLTVFFHDGSRIFARHF